ncbi:hypothetical protein [Acinetobacter bouvetii]|uniref:Uncharacterized protein n=1 Tax=Acinetobacter bouvetii TaxID=202951 RepID=A0A811G5W6_9GAMM|nr:hypothetical protein [Acinetobacter bouvetii]CAB1208097.1 hypothetical protein SFB21_0297 [Acinetobacter bouvetii]
MLVVPHKDGTFDHFRSVTTLEYLINDFNNEDIDERDLTHLDEILKLHDLSRDLDAGDIEAFEKI